MSVSGVVSRPVLGIVSPGAMDPPGPADDGAAGAPPGPVVVVTA
jgi:hypothetical protein